MHEQDPVSPAGPVAKVEGQHRWSLSWPGNHCRDCGMDGPESWDDALIDCPECSAGCESCSGTGCIPNPDQVVPPCPFSTSSASPAGT